MSQGDQNGWSCLGSVAQKSNLRDSHCNQRHNVGQEVHTDVQERSNGACCRTGAMSDTPQEVGGSRG